MNERIRELAGQAQKVVGYTDGGYTEIKALDQEKFAELIVKECIANCDDLNSMKYIANHFGVKVEGLE